MSSRFKFLFLFWLRVLHKYAEGKQSLPLRQRNAGPSCLMMTDFIDIIDVSWCIELNLLTHYYSQLTELTSIIVSKFHVTALSWHLIEQDLATQLYWWDHYRRSCRADSVKPQKFLRPEMAEWLSGPCLKWTDSHSEIIVTGFSSWLWGLPSGWTQPHMGSVNHKQFEQMFGFNLGPVGSSVWFQGSGYYAWWAVSFCQAVAQRDAPWKALSLFSGVGGLDLGLRALGTQLPTLSAGAVAVVKVFLELCSRLCLALTPVTGGWEAWLTFGPQIFNIELIIF